ncbi:predicted protein [Botrytis cinerea T4]|uniref:Uncharacterized protein n=1 Tax=Botryotinia fuckeliana (strain T4) TaxID=999810 RepID=G2YK50_BOTF4|nr:predicted protein [Botrytis cinerea T4]
MFDELRASFGDKYAIDWLIKALCGAKCLNKSWIEI